MTSVIDNETLLTLVEAWEALSERLRHKLRQRALFRNASACEHCPQCAAA